MSVQANWNDNRLLVWSATGAIAELRDLLGQISTDGLLASVAQDATIRVWLPDETQPGTLKEVELPALQFSPPEAVDLLVSLADPLPEMCGDSIRYWATLARFVIDSLRREKFFPSLRRREGHREAVWRLYLPAAEELERLERFANSMPPSCRAIVGEETPPIGLIESFITETADALIRRAVSNDPFFTRIHHLAAETGAGPEMRFLSALLAPGRAVPGEARDNEVLADQVQLWTSRLGGAAPASGWQLGFTLHEPQEQDPLENGIEAPSPDASWRVEFALVSLDDSKPLEAALIWEDASPLSPLGRQLPELRAVLLAELTRAAEVFPPLTRILGTAAPSSMELTTPEAQQFLRQWSIELRARSFSVDLPLWADETDRRLALVMALRPVLEPGASSFSGSGASAGAARMGLDSLLEFDWRVSLGGVELTPDEFDQLVRRQSPLVRIRGRWVEVEADLAAAAQELMERQAAGKTTLGDAFRAAFATTRDGRAPAVALSGTSWVKDLLDQLPAMKAQELVQPQAFQGTLRPYQLRGLQWLWFLDRLGIGGCLADDMGLGKTIQLIALLLHERAPVDATSAPFAQGQPTLLFAPTSVVGNWVKELERFAPNLRVLLHHGPQRLRGDAFLKSAQQNDVIITSYALAHRDRDELARVPWHRIALDEAQKIKNPSAASSVAIRSLSAPRRIAMTGTPIENHLSELWSIMDVLNPGLLGSARDFRERFAVPIEKLLDKDRAEHLRRMIRPFVLRRLKTDPDIAGDLPEKIEMKVYCNLTVEQAAMYERTTSEMLGQIDAATGIRRRGLILAVLTRLKQICDHPALVTDDDGEPQLDRRSGKCERLFDMLEEVIEEGESALVFTQYAQMGHLLQKMLAQRVRSTVHYLHGGTPQKQRDEMVQSFQECKTPGVFLLSLRAGGLGLNLTAASHVFHFDRWWNPAVENQATDRAHRIGQTRQVQVHKFIAVGTVEERIDRLLTEKTQLAQTIVGGGDEWLTDLSTSELREYLRLSDEAVGEF
jgi:SNF2 family DNA or RNA helicase